MNPPTGLLSDRTVLVTGVLRPSSIASAVAAVAAQQGARVLLSGHPRTLAATASVARGLGLPDPVTPLDVADADSLSALAPALKDLGVTRLDGLVHSIARADLDLLGTVLPLETPGAGGAGPESTARTEERMRGLERAFTVSAASLPALVDAAGPLLGLGSSVVTLTFDSARVYPGYGWMGPLKAALEASVRALAVELGEREVRVNAISSGPMSTTAAGAIRALRSSAGAGARSPPWAGTPVTPPPWHAPPWPCCRPGCRPPPARPSTLMAGHASSAERAETLRDSCP